ncbi:MAG: SPOR domain-containing protein [Gammaproteobacteria bacterium]
MAHREHRRGKQPQYARRQGGWLSFLTGLALGLFVAFLVYLHGRVPIPVPNGNAAGPRGERGPAPATPKPSFDFYTILPDTEVKVPDWEVDPPAPPPKTEPITPGPAPVTSKDRYLVQVGSFQRYESADRAKARLALLGVRAEIQRVVINGADTWYRVQLGPFDDLARLQATRKRLAENNINFVLVRMKAGAPPRG